MSDHDEFVSEFLEECEENLDQLDQDLVALEANPRDADRLASIFRTIHTIKGTSGFFSFAKLGGVAHSGETLLSRLREGRLLLNEEITSALLALVDSIREILGNIESSGGEGRGDYSALNDRMKTLIASASDEPIAIDEPSEIAVEDVASPNAETPSASGDAAISRDAESATAPERSTHRTNGEPDQAVVVSDGADPVAVTDQRSDIAGDEANPAGSNNEPASLVAASDSQGQTGGDDEQTESATESALQSSEEKVQGADETRSAAMSEGSIRVDVGLLNQLMDLVGELVLARNQLMQFTRTSDDRPFANVAQQMSRITSELQERVMKTRMQPIGNIWGRYPRIVRDLAVGCGKEIQLDMEGRDTELDKSLLEAIKDPLTHLIRNSVDHGIEMPEVRSKIGKPAAGRLLLRSWHEGGQVNIEITDDGGGIDAEKVKQKAIANGLISPEAAVGMTDQQIVQLIFRPGFSTAEKITDISGRGVGMDVVRTNIESIGGTIDVHSRSGLGTTMRVKIPLTLAIVPALMVEAGEERFAIPQVQLVELLRMEGAAAADAVEMIHDTPVYRSRGRLLPLVYLSEQLQLSSDDRMDEATILNIVVLQAENLRFGLVVDQVLNTEEIVVKPLNRALSIIPHLAGATIMGDGRVALILDVFGLAESVGLDLETIEKRSDEQSPSALRNHEDHSLLVCELRSGRRLAIPLTSVDRLEDFPASSVEFADDQEVVQYRDQIMPLVRLASEPRPDTSPSANDASVKAVVIRDQDHRCGVVVERIVDVVHPQTAIRRSQRSGVIAGSAVIEGAVTDVVNAAAVLSRTGQV